MATISKRGNRWFAQVRRKGYPAVYKTFGSKSDAMVWTRVQEAQIDRAEVGPTKLPRSLTLKGILERYLAEITPQKRSAESERLRLMKLMRHPVCSLPLSDVSSSAIASFRDERIKVAAAGTVCRELSLIHHALEVARREWGFRIPVNPVQSVTKPRLQNARNRRLRGGELERLQSALAQTRNPLVGSIVLFAIETGMRRAEILSLQWSLVSLDQRTAHIPVSKTGKARTIALSPRAIAILSTRRDLTEGEGLVFPITANAFRLAWERLRTRAGLKDLRFHDLRHEAISRFFEIGLALPEVALLSGHRDSRMLLRYTHMVAQDVALKLERLSSNGQV